jgi:plasmid stability protein
MSSITIRNLDDSVKRRLRLRAAERNRSMEEEARDILRCALAQEPEVRGNLADAIRQIIEPLGGVDLPRYRAARYANRLILRDRPRHERVVGSAADKSLGCGVGLDAR